MTSEAEPDTIQSERDEAGQDISNIDEGEGEAEEADYEDAEDEGEDYLPLTAVSDDPEKQRSYKDYKRLVKDINCQNKTLEWIKDQINIITCKPCPTRCEKNDLKGLYESLEQEMQKLHCLINKAMKLQNFGSRRRYREIPIFTLDDVYMAPIPHTCESMQVQSSKSSPTKRELGRCRESAGESSEFDKSCSYQETPADDHLTGQMCEGEEKKMIKEILAAFKPHPTKKPCQKTMQDPCKKSDSMEKIKDKINCMQQTMNKLKDTICKHEVEKNQSVNCAHQQNQQTSLPPMDAAILCSGTKSPKAEQFNKLKENYLYLLTEFSKKEELLKELTKKVQTSCGSCATDHGGMNGGNATEAELQLLRNRVNEMKEEQVEFKCLMREQSLQLEDYRNKYLLAQQKVEEQSALLEKLSMNNKRIEKQINFEIKEIRAKFQEKLNELLQFPKLLENEQIKLAQTCKEKDDLESKLIIVCKELKNIKSSKEKDNNEDCKPQLQRCQQELTQAKKNIDEIQRQRDMFCEQLRSTVEDLDTLRSESAKIIARTKERAELLKKNQQDEIDRLEKQLAQCRATACLSVSDRETVIREMQGQLNTLSYSFDAAQKQIKTLRNHISYMSNENSFPAKC